MTDKMQILSDAVIPLIVCMIVGCGIIKKRNVFSAFLTGAEDGMKMTFSILPTMLALMTGIGVLRSSGLLDASVKTISKVAAFIHIPGSVLGVALVRMISNSAATGLLLDIFQHSGPDSQEGMTAAVILSSTETLVYCVSIYCGSVNIKRTAWIIPGALFASAAGIAAAVVVCGI